MKKQKEYEVDIHIWHEGEGYYTLSNGKRSIAKGLTLDDALASLRDELELLEERNE